MNKQKAILKAGILFYGGDNMYELIGFLGLFIVYRCILIMSAAAGMFVEKFLVRELGNI